MKESLIAYHALCGMTDNSANQCRVIKWIVLRASFTYDEYAQYCKDWHVHPIPRLEDAPMFIK